MNVGAVAAMRNIKDAIAVARHVLENTEHTLLVGDRATEFAEMMGFKKESLSTPVSKSMWKSWKKNQCQPNFWTVNILQFFLIKKICTATILNCQKLECCSRSKNVMWSI